MSSQLEMFSGRQAASDVPFRESEIVESAARWFRSEGFPVPPPCAHSLMQAINLLAGMDDGKLPGTTVGYKELDGYFPHRYGVPCQRRKTPRTSPSEAFASDDMLRVCLSKAMQCSKKIPAGYFPELGWANGIQLAANFRPGFALHAYRSYCPAGGAIFDPCAGFGGRAVAALAHSSRTRYYALDASSQTVSCHREMMRDIGRDGLVEVTHAAAEDVPPSAVEGRFNLSFTCPPYFKKEHYSADPEQACRRYESFGEFVEGFLRPMTRLQASAVKRGGVVCVVVADVKIAYKEHSLVAATKNCCEAAGLLHERDIPYRLTRRPGDGHDEVSSEVCVVYRASGGRA